MRPVQELGLAPLNEEDIQDMLNEHIPYRLSLLRDGYRPPWIPPCQHTHQALEAGSVSAASYCHFSASAVIAMVL